MNTNRTIARQLGTALVIAAHLALGAISVGCGSDDNTSGSTSAVAIFTPDTPTPANGSITLLAGTRSGASVNVRVTATEIPDFFGATFRIAYDTTALQFSGMDDATSFLRTGVTDSDVFFIEDHVNVPGQVLVTATRLNATLIDPVDVTTTADLVILNFIARKPIIVDAPEGRLDFADPKEVCDGTVSPCGTITVTAWDGGGVSAQ